ncbi:branched-chain amino acid ABC transporter permease [Lapillicoccus sp.]|uniref:branched-chain amino acid ABC transporter permease n=1 Tax=Lapillicoccus sp. TaxID=1909287 RepID=UPI0025D2609C|nr:branched-chain amino acid ABC transporter permease [Lapillicoccus sp.]
MSTVSTPTQIAPTPGYHPSRIDGLREQHGRLAWLLVLTGLVVLAAGCFLSWSYDPEILGNLSISFNPGSLQLFMLTAAVLALVYALAYRGPLRGLGVWIDSAKALMVLGIGALGFMAITLAVVAVTSSGLINIDPGGWVSLVGSLVLAVGGSLLERRPTKDTLHAQLPAWVEIGTIVVLMAMLLFGAAYALGQTDGNIFGLFLVFVVAVAWSLFAAGFFTWLGIVAQRHRRVLMLGAFAVAFLFPFTQNGSDANMSIATQVLIFAATALGLNIVVGLAGLLDLGYIAFLGAGAYTAATLSTSAFATIGWKPPFLVVVLLGAIVAATLGLIIGTPTLRVSGDYLAIVTLAFGEIFRLSMSNLDGNNGPDLTHGPNGIPAIPDLQIGSFNFGDEHTILGFSLGRFANYYFVLLVLALVIITVFSRLNNSRIGRGWVAIREDEKAAEAMGVNVFGLKLFAFASGAFLAGMAGTVKAHQDVSVTPDQYVFLESAFLLAAVVLGGMGTVAGVFIGATILKLLPEKLRFISDYRLLIFGVLLVLMMRVRPEGIIASQRRQLEFHEEDEALAERIEEVHLEEEAQT